jgi:hypothetical protein
MKSTVKTTAITLTTAATAAAKQTQIVSFRPFPDCRI